MNEEGITSNNLPNDGPEYDYSCLHIKVVIYEMLSLSPSRYIGIHHFYKCLPENHYEIHD